MATTRRQSTGTAAERAPAARRSEPSTLPARRAVDALTPAKESRLGYPEVCRLRRAAYTEHLDQHGLREALAEFRAAMEANHGALAQAWHNVVPWDVAFMVGRYGEAIDYWPTELSEADAARLKEWGTGPAEWPNGIKAHPELRAPGENELLLGQDEYGEVPEAEEPVSDEEVGQ